MQWIQLQLWERHKLHTVRRTLLQLSTSAKVDEVDGTLTLEEGGIVTQVLVVYFRYGGWGVGMVDGTDEASLMGVGMVDETDEASIMGVGMVVGTDEASLMGVGMVDETDGTLTSEEGSHLTQSYSWWYFRSGRVCVGVRICECWVLLL